MKKLSYTAFVSALWFLFVFASCENPQGQAIEAPQAPENLVATPGVLQINLNWEASINASSSNTPSHYSIEYSKQETQGDEKTEWVPLVNSQEEYSEKTYTHIELDTSLSYRYRVTAHNSVGDSPSSELSDFVTPLEKGTGLENDNNNDVNPIDGDDDDMNPIDSNDDDVNPVDNNNNDVNPIDDSDQSNACLDSATDNEPDSDDDGAPDICDVDDDGDGLIEIRTLSELNNVRNNLAGTTYNDDNTGCGNESDITVCSGYELMNDLDFEDADNNGTKDDPFDGDAVEPEGNWLPIGSCNDTVGVSSSFCNDTDDEPFAAQFQGNGYTISGMEIKSYDSSNGLFGYIGSSSVVRNIIVENATLENISNRVNIYQGVLAGYNNGIIISCGVINSTVSGDDSTSGNDGFIGGLVGGNNGTIVASWALANLTGHTNYDIVGGLVGENNSNGVVVASWFSGDVTNTNTTLGGSTTGFIGSMDSGGRVISSWSSAGITAEAAFMQLSSFILPPSSVGLTTAYRESITITASRGFASLSDNAETGISASDDATTISTPEQITQSNSSTSADNRWSTRVWDFGTTSQTPAVKWITGYNPDGTTEQEKYLCDESLLPPNVDCGDTIPNQR